MSLDTEVTGDPGSVESASRWLSGTLGPSVQTGADTLVSARSDADSDWDGDAGRAFSSSMRTAAVRADDLHSTVTDVANAIDTYAAELRTAQNRMVDVREVAAAGGLAVHGFTIENPGAGPTRPGPMTVGPDTPPQAVVAHSEAVAAYDAQQDKIRAWNTALEDARQVRAQLTTAADTLADTYRGLEGPEWVLTAADIAGGAAGGVMAFNASALRGSANVFRQQAVRELDRALKTNPAHVGRQRWYRNLDDAKRLGSSSDDMARSADDLAKRSRAVPLKLGGALAVAGIGYDIVSGEDPVQAVASGGGGFLASVGAGAATGALIGTAVPIPGVGTAAGAVIGAGVGIFTSGAIDSLFENGPDVGAAVDAGWDAVEDTGEVIGDAAGAVGGAIGGLFD